jgi:ribosomal protein S25
MDDRKQRIDKLSERFKERSGRPKQSAKDRARRSFYLDNEIVERLDKDYKKFNHQAYPHTVSKSVFMETILEYGLNNLPLIKELIKEKAGTEPQED